jgi:hypothetical protein
VTVRVASLAIVFALVACDEEPSRREPPTEGAAETTRSAEAPAAEAPLPEATQAERLARNVFRAAGGEALAHVGELRFTFVVEDSGARVFEAEHRWDRLADRDRVTYTDREGRAVDAIVDLGARIACGTVGGEIAAGEAQQTLSEQAYGRWVNDAYWLMMPVKVLDPGVRHAVGEPREHDGARYQVLELSFDGVGLTPGDRYTLFVDPGSNRVVRWEMQLEGQDGEPRGMSWADYREIGPLVLALDHATDDGSRHVRFEDVEVLASPSPDHFAVEGCPQ